MFITVRNICSLTILLLPNILFAKEKTTVFQVGLHFSIGTHVNRIGLSTGFILIDNHFQFNVKSLLNYSLSSYGPKKKRFEWQLSEGFQYFFSEKKNRASSSIILNELSNLSQYKYGIGYTLKQYIDNCGTSQHSAMFSVRINNLLIASENDLFLFDFLDKYRSGSLLVRLEALKQPFAIQYKLQIYTGNSLCNSCTARYDSLYKRNYISIPKHEGGSLSHGISSLELEASFYKLMSTRLSLGMDNEKIRNTVQNLIIHDQIFLPKKWRNPNAHIPMLNSDGSAHLDKEKPLRKNRPFLQLGINDPLFW